MSSLQRRLSSAGLSTDSALPWLQPLPPLPGLTFPTVSELVEQELYSPTVEVDDGLFSQLVQDPLVLYREYLDDPERFDERVGLLLQQLVSNQKKLEELTAEERGLLNTATAEHAQYVPKPKPPPAQQPKASPLSDSSYEDGDEESELPWKGRQSGPAPTAMELPADLPTAPSFWWKKS